MNKLINKRINNYKNKIMDKNGAKISGLLKTVS